MPILSVIKFRHLKFVSWWAWLVALSSLAPLVAMLYIAFRNENFIIAGLLFIPIHLTAIYALLDSEISANCDELIDSNLSEIMQFLKVK